jgi:hypothetical protein
MAADRGISVKQLLRDYDSHELSEWLAYYRIEPRVDPYWIGGMVASTLANIHRGKSSRVYKPSDFMPATKTKTAKPIDNIRALEAHMELWSRSTVKK